MRTTDQFLELPTTQFDVSPDWIDSYGHMNSAKYIVAFDHHGYNLFEHFGIGASYTQQQRLGLYMIEIHTAFRKELLAGTPLELRVRFLASDNKRVHCLMELFNAREGYLAATMEQLSINVDLNTRKVTPFTHDVEARMKQVVQAHARHELPAGFYPRLTLTRRTGPLP